MKTPKISLFENIVSHHCWLCHQSRSAKRPNDAHADSYFCGYCLASFMDNRHSCSICASPLESELALVCASCQKKPPHYNQCISRFRFESEVQEVLHAFKYKERLDYGKAMSFELAHLIQQNYRHLETPSLMIPVPLHHSHLRQRGFNQAREICRTLKKQTGIAYLNNVVVRKKNTQRQHTLNADERKKNLRDAFSINKRLLNTLQKHSYVAIVDDIVTTTSTCNELAKALKENGVKKIDIWSLARASRIK